MPNVNVAKIINYFMKNDILFQLFPNSVPIVGKSFPTYW